MRVYDITPVPKPRMTKSDRWKKRDCVQRYWDFKDEIKEAMPSLPDSYHVFFIMPMPKSWAKKKKAAMEFQPHRQKPDKDNLEKALLDALHTDDSHVWDGRVTKIWGYKGQIVVIPLDEARLALPLPF